MPLRSAKQRLAAAQAFVLSDVDRFPRSIIGELERRFGLKRSSARRVLDAACDQRVVRAVPGRGGTAYELVRFARVSEIFPIAPGAAEHEIWNQIKPHDCWCPENVLGICHYGVTEMVNNVIDHSGSDKVYLSLDYTAHQLTVWIIDTGVGIFSKVQQALGLPRPEDAILELVKGKFTTSPDHHTGEGIFFTSRAFDSFSMISDDLIFLSGAAGGEWLSKRKTASSITGTAIMLQIDPRTNRTLKDVLDEFSPDVDVGFQRTKVPVRLADSGEQSFISRSQAKRLLARFERFQEVILDFAGVPDIGPSFADEVFRVFRLAHPGTTIRYVNANDRVLGMIRRAMAADAPQP